MYTIRIPGHSAWATGITSIREALFELERAERIAEGHVVYFIDDGAAHPMVPVYTGTGWTLVRGNNQ